MTKFKAQATAHKLIFQTKRGFPTEEGFKKMTLARNTRITMARTAETQ